MRVASQTSSPQVRVHSATPSSTDNQTSMLAQQQLPGGTWGDMYSGTYLSALPRNMKDTQFHKRGSSGSSITSAGPPSPLSHNTLYPHIATSDPNFSPSFDFDFNQTSQPTSASKSLPASTSDAIMYPGKFGSLEMRRNQSSGPDERASYTMSTMSHNSPATPHTNYENDFEDSKSAYSGEIFKSGGMAQFLPFETGYPTAAYQQSLQDVFPDQSYQSAAFRPSQQQIQRMVQAQQRPTMMADRLHAAQQDHLRTSSPMSNSRDKSPFRQNSPYMPSQAPRQQPLPQLQKTRTSISPKELMLDDHDIDETAEPLFPQQQPFFTNQRNQSNLSQFYMPQLAQDQSAMHMQQNFPMFGQGYRQPQSSMQEGTPDFPAHLVSMESTGEEGVSEPSSQQSAPSQSQRVQPTSQPQSRPVDTSSDAGTYSCTYHGCSMRFESPAKLQKHKREGHRQVSPGTTQNLVLRNSQAGPHRCDRINPTTGKPCNSIFSRPYDLTRHEDTIHNGRKQKVRCPYCTEEKTFSRADALTRHLRVVHPDIQTQTKQKRSRK